MRQNITLLETDLLFMIFLGQKSRNVVDFIPFLVYKSWDMDCISYSWLFHLLFNNSNKKLKEISLALNSRKDREGESVEWNLQKERNKTRNEILKRKERMDRGKER